MIRTLSHRRLYRHSFARSSPAAEALSNFPESRRISSNDSAYQGGLFSKTRMKDGPKFSRSSGWTRMLGYYSLLLNLEPNCHHSIKRRLVSVTLPALGPLCHQPLQGERFKMNQPSLCCRGCGKRSVHPNALGAHGLPSRLADAPPVKELWHVSQESVSDRLSMAE